jgi:hypothetical protein
MANHTKQTVIKALNLSKDFQWFAIELGEKRYTIAGIIAPVAKRDKVLLSDL